MSTPACVSYVIAVTGIAGVVIAIINIRRNAQHKAADLRLELRKSDADIRAIVAALPSLFEQAKNSRIAVASATGQSGAKEQWLRDLEADLSSFEILKAELPASPNVYMTLGQVKLEARLVDLYSLRSTVSQLSEKYQASLIADDKEREQIRATWSRLKSPYA